MAPDGTAETVTLSHIRSYGCRDLLVYCGAIDCNHSAVMNADRCRPNCRSAHFVRAWSASVAVTAEPTSDRTGGPTQTSGMFSRLAHCEEDRWLTMAPAWSGVPA